MSLSKLALTVASPPEYDRLVVEIETAEILDSLITISVRGGALVAEFKHSIPHANVVNAVLLDDLIRALTDARSELLSTYPNL